MKKLHASHWSHLGRHLIVNQENIFFTWQKPGIVFLPISRKHVSDTINSIFHNEAATGPFVITWGGGGSQVRVCIFFTDYIFFKCLWMNVWTCVAMINLFIPYRFARCNIKSKPCRCILDENIDPQPSISQSEIRSIRHDIANPNIFHKLAKVVDIKSLLILHGARKGGHTLFFEHFFGGLGVFFSCQSDSIMTLLVNNDMSLNV